MQHMKVAIHIFFCFENLITFRISSSTCFRGTSAFNFLKLALPKR